ncbi:hypothetical protein DAPPUDRAFT_227966 [Daphnia pulex]|uniref:THAP-type domain-containing protein n=1 Tax=Daphnia pulex TaxID=6669 RepID=E9HA53_DAPPU|nr:hypothetical protein DAPPUDRAFT_227966 [Daphnia pulex]|eukprot:EFX71370.1 hypothetical protein DAPPUDRAFT_227966 [Daphnia pulex]
MPYRKCCLKGCDRNSRKNKDASFFQFPKVRQDEQELTETRLYRWRKRVNIPDDELKKSFVCDKHFVLGCPSYERNVNSPDWAPCLLLENTYITKSDCDRTRRRVKCLPTYKGNRRNQTVSTIENKDVVAVEPNVEDNVADAGENSRNPNMSTNEDKEVGCAEPNASLADHVYAGESNESNITFHSESVSEIHDDTGLVSNLGEIPSHNFQESDLQQPDLNVELKKVIVELQNRNSELASKKYLNYNLKSPEGKPKKQKDLYTRCIEDVELMVYYTRFTPTAFEAIFKGVLPLKHNNNSCLDFRRQFFLTLTKLVHNFGFQDLSVQFNVSRQTVSNYFHFWVGLLHDRFFSRAVFWPSQGSLKKTMPMCFRMDFFNTAAILDCFEIQIDTPHIPTDQAASFSSHKQRTTVKYLISVSPQGSFNFVSNGFCGRVSDKQVVIDSGILNNLKHGDLILADRGFPLEEVVASRGAQFMVPAFMKERNQLPEIETRRIENVRIHVERILGATRARFQMLKGPIDRNFLNSDNESTGFVDKIVKVCCMLTNLLPSVVPLD